MSNKPATILQLSVIVSALGFFVDVYDLLLFAIIRKASLGDLGLTPELIVTEGERLISIQMIGMLLGGIFFGVIGDKKGRLSVLFGSILLYSVANILNGMVTNIPQYMVLRFIAGFGLAGELGAGLTLVSEQLPKEKRSLAAGLIAGFGVLGAVFAFFIKQYFDWRTCFYIGGGMGLLLLVLRVQVFESSLFKDVKESTVERGNFLMFFNDKQRFIKYLQCVLIGLPVWYIIGILVTFSDQFGKAFGIEGIDPGKAIMSLYLGVGLGDVAVGWLSERLKSRKKTYFIFLRLTMALVVLFFLQHGSSAQFYWICFALGFGAGFNVVYLTMGVEQFGTNLRASAAISIPNMVRGSLPLIILLFQGLRTAFGDYLTGAWVTGVILFLLAEIAAWFMDETYGKDLDFLEK
jgi:predicted MFS family arabinose efflux permease